MDKKRLQTCVDNYKAMLKAPVKNRKLGDCTFITLENFLIRARPHVNQSFHLPKPSHHRIVAIGDIHADFEKLLQALCLSGAIDEGCRWLPERDAPLTVVVTGDVLDQGGRTDEDEVLIEPKEVNKTVELDIVQFLFHLDERARDTRSGRVHVTLGNHELENFRGNFQSSTPDTNLGWGGVFGRTEAFRRGGGLANVISSSWPLILCLGNVVFTHAGLVVPAKNERKLTFKKYVDLVNAHVRDFLQNRADLPDWVDEVSTTRAVSENFRGTVAQCAKFAREVLSPLEFGDRFLIVGHTPQIVAWSRSGKNGINGVCENRIWRIDVAMSKAFGNSGDEIGVEVLDIAPGPVFTVLSTLKHRKPQKPRKPRATGTGTGTSRAQRPRRQSPQRR